MEDCALEHEERPFCYFGVLVRRYLFNWAINGIYEEGQGREDEVLMVVAEKIL